MGDLDLITEERFLDQLHEALAEIGFLPSKSRYFKHPDCDHLFLEFPPGPVEIGESIPSPRPPTTTKAGHSKSFLPPIA